MILPTVLRSSFLVAMLAFSPGRLLPQEPSPELIELEKFLIEEKPAGSEKITLTARPVDNLFGPSLEVLEIPRSVSVLTPEALRQYGIRDFSDLDKFGAGTARINYFGLAGHPVLRGAKAGVYFDGILRAFQRNEMPASFGAVEQFEIVRGPAPAHLSPTLVGGFVNYTPKQPFFEKDRYELKFSVGAWDFYQVQADAGGGFLLAGQPAAYRASFTGQLAEGYYNAVRNDYFSVYASLKSRLSEGVILEAGAETFVYRSNENPGWNRPTQQLVDHGAYVIGEPADLTSPAWGGHVVRTLLEFPYTQIINPALHALAIPGEIARAQISPELLATLIDLNDPSQRAKLYSLRPVEAMGRWSFAAPIAQAALDATTKPAQDAYVYTPEYFAAGGKVLTAPLSGNKVLADADDFADAENFLAFVHIKNTRSSDRTWRNQLFIEGINTSKSSSYGYAIETEQWVADNKFTIQETHDSWLRSLTYGAEIRFTHSQTLQDFFAEPFSRRDLSRSTISANSIVAAGAQTDPYGVNLWSPQIGANLRSILSQAALFALGQFAIGQRLTIQAGWRGEAAYYTTGLPGAVERASQDIRVRSNQKSSVFYYSASLSPLFRLTDAVHLYASLQYGTGLDPATGGVIYGKGNFSRVELYEAGLKTAFFQGRLITTSALYYWDQSKFSERDNRAEPLHGEGFEWESSLQLTNHFTINTAFTAQRVRVRADTVNLFGARNFSEEQWALHGGILNGWSKQTFPNNPRLEYPAFPEVSASLFLLFEMANGLGISGGPIWRDGYWHNFDHTIRLPSSLLWNASIFYRRGSWDIHLQLENLTREDYFLGAEPAFSSNTLLAKGPDRNWRLSIGYTW